jgi:NAD(P)-dependent dehydrogenase (short-subunit alcohol dehydrogenase family)
MLNFWGFTIKFISKHLSSDVGRGDYDVNRLQGKIALVVGAGSVGTGWGNGKACAVLFAREGARVFAVDKNKSAADETKRIIRKEGGTCVSFEADAVRAESVRDMIDACVGEYGRIDTLQNNVGGSVPGGVVEMPEEVWDANIDHNLKSAFLSCKYAVPVMLRSGSGSIVNVSSIAGMRYHRDRDMVSYSAAKGGLMELTRAVALKYADKGLRANTVVPGLMNTPLVTERIAAQYGDGDTGRMIASRDALCPSGKMGDAWDVAYASLFLASDESKYVNGTELVVDGGLTAQCC